MEGKIGGSYVTLIPIRRRILIVAFYGEIGEIDPDIYKWASGINYVYR